ncbi:MAG: HindIII family type II restriction endonuclease [Synergistaceae bacterium]|nr:HindIII family type II restriction endonuclease [Synergistaceae bacterium]
MYEKILNIIEEAKDEDFDKAVGRLENYVDSDSNFLAVLREIGTIPEHIPHDSTEEKLFSKASDAVLSRAFREIGLKSAVLRERGDSADVLAESPIFGYTLVADAKAFRLSRTAKNQKDFKVTALSAWRKDAEYAVLCSPYFQYPTKASQIYAQALEHNVCLLSWEHLLFLLEKGVRERKNFSLAPLWGFCKTYSHRVLCSDMKKCFIPQFNDALLESLGLGQDAFFMSLNRQKRVIVERGGQEKAFWINVLERIQRYSREEVIEELIRTKKIHEKIAQIDAYIDGVQTSWTSTMSS